MVSKAARLIFSAYRRDEFADPDNFLLQVGMVLERYTDQVINTVSHPTTGIQRRSKWPPSIAELVDECDEQAERNERIKRLGQYRTTPREPRQPADTWANVFVPAYSALYPVMVKKTEKADPREWRYVEGEHGIWVTLGWLK